MTDTNNNPISTKVVVAQTFEYSYKTRSGTTKKSEINAISLSVAKLMLKQQNIIPTKIKKKSEPFFKKTNNFKKVKALDIALFTRQMSTMGIAGIPLVQSFAVIAESTEHSGIKHLAEEIKRDIESGSSFSQAIKKMPAYFDNLFCSLVEAGEQSGSLDEMLLRVAIYKEKMETLKRKIKKAMYYPITVLFIAFIVTLILLLKVVPTFKTLFSGFGADLPEFTLFILSISDFLRENFIMFSIGISALTATVIYAHRHSPNFREALQRFSLKIPVFGPLLRKTVIARYARTLSTTFAAGVPLADALGAIARATGNVVFYNAIIDIKKSVTNGQQLKVAMKKSGIFPALVIQMVGIGEESGTLEEMLGKVANIYEEEVDSAVDGLTTLLEPFIMVILGIVVGSLVVAMYLPIFKMGSVV